MCSRQKSSNGARRFPVVSQLSTWTEPYARIANELELPARTADAAARAVTAWVIAIVAA